MGSSKLLYAPKDREKRLVGGGSTAVLLCLLSCTQAFLPVPDQSGRPFHDHGPLYSIRRRPLQMPAGDELFLGNISSPELMGWDVLEPEEEGYRRLGLPPPDIKAQDFRDLKVRLRYGPSSTGGGSTARAGKTFVEFVTPYALCYPQGTRAKGCQELIQSNKADGKGCGPMLPCVEGGRCPFVRFTCNKGHTWNAEPGSPACFYCPTCKLKTRGVKGEMAMTPSVSPHTYSYSHSHSQSQSQASGPLGRGRGRPSTWSRAVKRQRLALRQVNRLRAVAEGHGGKLLSRAVHYRGLKGRLLFACNQGHEWEAQCGNVLAGSWCPTCAALRLGQQRRLSLVDMQLMAAHFGGRCLSERYEGSNTKLLWECRLGHRFVKAPNNIRRASGRHFCSTCARLSRRAQQQAQARGSIHTPMPQDQGQDDDKALALPLPQERETRQDVNVSS